jgi:predicted SnoaL-like aldol condensation-catalyzing enzyme
MTTDTKAAAMQAFALLLETGDTDVLEPLLSDGFVHHRPDGTSTRAEWLAAVRGAFDHLADMEIEVHHVMGEGNLVMVHARRWLPEGGPEIVTVDILRFENDQVTEAWEIIEPLAEAASHLTWWEPARHVAA